MGHYLTEWSIRDRCNDAGSQFVSNIMLDDNDELPVHCLEAADVELPHQNSLRPSDQRPFLASSSFDSAIA